MPEWDPEIEIDADAARDLIGGQFLELGGATIEPLGVGWDNVVFRVAGDWAFRFPRRSIAIPGVEREIDVLGRLATHLPLSIPTPRWVGAPSAAYPWPWFGARFLSGVELALAGLADDDRTEAGAALGEFLRVLHAPRLARLVGTTLPVDPMRRADMGLRAPFARQRIAQAAEVARFQPPAELDALLSNAERLPPSPRTRVVHGDLHARHVLIDGHGRVSGVIDWGDVCMGDPSIDLSVAYGSFTGAARRALLDAYGPIDGLTELRARVIGTFLAAALLAYAVDRDLPAIRDESRRALERILT